MSVPAFGEADIFLGRRVCGCVHFVREGVGRCVAFGVHVDAGRKYFGVATTGGVDEVGFTGSDEVSPLPFLSYDGHRRHILHMPHGRTYSTSLLHELNA